jgi:hypothetical protein
MNSPNNIWQANTATPHHYHHKSNRIKSKEEFGGFTVQVAQGKKGG